MNGMWLDVCDVLVVECNVVGFVICEDVLDGILCVCIFEEIGVFCVFEIVCVMV